MTPEEARQLHDKLINGSDTESVFDIVAAAPEMATMIAGMRAEYAIEHQIVPGGEWHQVTRWSNDQHPLNKGYEPAGDERIIVRYVTAPQPLGEEQ